MTGCLVRNTRCMAASTAWPISANSGPRWSMVGMSMARSTRSGTLVGPGICRKCLPLCTVMGVLPGLGLSYLGFASRSNITIWRACPPPGEGRQCIRSRASPCQAGYRQARHGRDIQRERDQWRHRGPKNHEIRRKTAALAARLAREIDGRRFLRRLQPRPLRDRRLVLPDPAASAWWCPGPWTRRCGRLRSPGTRA